MAGKGQGKYGKRDMEEEDTKPAIKKPKLQQVVSLGHGCNLNTRHAEQLLALAALITTSKVGFNTTDDKTEVLEDASSSHGLYMEWDKENDTYFLGASNRAKELKIKFELLAAFGASSLDLDVKNPMVAFSQGFNDCDQWEGVKSFLFELFGRQDPSCDVADFLYAFTRTGEKFHMRIYKIQTMTDLEDKRMKLEQINTSFVLKPVRMYRSETSDIFLDEDKLNMFQRTDPLTLVPCTSYYDISCPATIRHMVQYMDVPGFIFMLPTPPDSSQWEGFNTTVAEYFERFYAFKKTKVPGTGVQPVALKTSPTPEVEYCHLCLPFKVFARSLIIQCGENFKAMACFKKIEEEHIFFRGKTMRILGVKLVNYTVEKAKENLGQVAGIITSKLNQLGLPVEKFPVDLVHVLGLLKAYPVKETKIDPLKNYAIAKNHAVWMTAEGRIHMMDVLFADLMNHMNALQQKEAGKGFPGFKELGKRVQRNWLMADCREYGLKEEVKSNPQKMKDYYAKQRDGLMDWAGNNRNLADELRGIQQCFKTCRNAYHHLSKSAEKMGVGCLTRKQVDLVVTSLFCDVYVKAQTGVTGVYEAKINVMKSSNPLDKEKASYERFAAFFQADVDVKFEEGDEK